MKSTVYVQSLKYVSATSAAFSTPSVGKRDWTTVHHKLLWNVVLLPGSGFALARGVQVAGSGIKSLHYIREWENGVEVCGPH